MRDYTVIVTGVPRSGTSMTMRILHFGGLEVMTRLPQTENSFNKYGCYEYGNMDTDLTLCSGKAIKCMNPAVLFATPKYKYKVIFPIRDMEQILKSRDSGFRKQEITDKNRRRIQAHLDLNKHIIKTRKDFEVLEIPYLDYFNKTREVCQKIADFLGGEFDIEKAITAVDKSLLKVR